MFFARIPADMNEVILVGGHSVDDTIKVASERVRARLGGEDAALRGWALGKDETAPPHSRMPPTVISVKTT